MTDKATDTPATEVVMSEEFSIKRSLILAVFFPVGAALGWAGVIATGGFGGDAIASAPPKALVSKPDPAAAASAEARRVAKDTAEKVARRVATDVARKVSREVATKVARDTALQALQNAQ